jgi:hypothetical protein
VTPPRAGKPITVALVDDYDVVLAWVAHMFELCRDRVVVAPTSRSPATMLRMASGAHGERSHRTTTGTRWA